MVAPWILPIVQRGSRQSAVTLVELLISMAIMTILVGGMASAVLIASRAVPDEEDLSLKTARAVDAATLVAADLATATRVLSAGANSVEFLVPDRGHGAVGPETIRYAWSGTPNSSLTRTYNGGGAVAVCKKLHAFSLTYATATRPLSAPPRVVLLVSNDVAPEAPDVGRKALMESWGFTVRLLDDQATQDQLTAALTNSDALYISERVNTLLIASLSLNPSRGVINEETLTCPTVGFATTGLYVDNTAISVVDNTHEITAAFTPGARTICTAMQPLTRLSGTLAAAYRGLADVSGGSALGVVELGGALSTGASARGRRVKLPWGGNMFTAFDMNALTGDAKVLLQRSIVWAAAPVCYSRVSIVIQCGGDTSSEVRSSVRLLNLPRVEAP